MRYNKEHIKKDGRHLLRGGPRDIQRRQAMAELQGDQSVIVDLLKQEIADLKRELSNRPKGKGGGFTAEEVDMEIHKAVESAVKELTTEFEKEKDKLQHDINNFKQIVEAVQKEKSRNLIEVEKLNAKIETQQALLAEKDARIEELKQMRTSVPVAYQQKEDPDRPKMEEVFVDPLEKDAGEGMEAHINVSDITIDEKENMEDKVNKLRNIMGKLKK